MPKTAIFKHDEEDYIWVLEDGRATMRNVIKGKELRTDYIINEGLANGEYVIQNANDENVKENIRVKLH